MQTFRIRVFCSDSETGNPAGVVLDADELSDDQMQRLAAEIGATETAFVTGGDDPSIRWFSPTCEVSLCGHVTIAAAHALDRPRGVTFHSSAGDLTVRPTPIGGETIWWLSRPAPEVRAFGGDAGPILAALGDPPLDDELPLATTPEQDLLIPLRNWRLVEALAPDLDALGPALEEQSLRGACALAVPGPDIYEVRCRFFAPNLGIPEDPATGSVHGAIAVYLHLNEVFEHWPEELRALSLEGIRGGRGGMLYLRLAIDEATNRPLTAEVGGLARRMDEGEG